MKWPNHTDYQDALQDPQTCFDLPELRGSQPVTDALGLPRVMSGNFASVYEVATTEGRRWAVRCFVRQVTGTQARYARLSEHLDSVKVPWLVEFEFILKGVMVHGEWYPIVKMQWVEGCPINNYLEEHLNEPETLLNLAGQFRTLVADLRRHKIAHGDFQHGNIMVTPQGELRLVDYDGMYCPAFGKKRSPELGHANFQHPLRLADYYDESLDNFSALVIYISLLALAAEPALWKEFYTGDNLLFSSNDYRNTQGSKLFERLKASPNPEVRQLATLLQHCCVSPLAMVPWFEETIVALKNGTLEESMSIFEIAAPSDAAGSAGPGSDGWWENSQARTAIGTRKAPTGTRPATAAAALAGGRLPSCTPEGSRPAPAVLGSRPADAAAAGSRPAEPIGSGSRPAPISSGSRPATSVLSEPIVPEGSQQEEGGLSMAVKLAIAALIVLILIGIGLSARRNVAPPPPAAESREAQ
jgi:hypothetical protein